jgi:hypothetical protein
MPGPALRTRAAHGSRFPLRHRVRSVRDASIDYDRHAPEYPRHRQADPRIAASIHAALGDARTVLNVGAGSGSYEPEDRYVLAVEP